MVRGYREANLGAGVEPPVRRVEHDVRGSERVLRREQDAAVVDPSLELRRRRASEREVPLEQVALERRGVVLVGRVLHELPDVGMYPLDGRVLDVHGHLVWIVLPLVVVIVVAVVVVVMLLLVPVLVLVLLAAVAVGFRVSGFRGTS